MYGRLDLLILGVGDLLNKIDDGTSKLCVWNLHESFGEVEPVGCGEIVCHVLRRRSIGLCMMLTAHMRCTLKEKCNGHPKYLRKML